MAKFKVTNKFHDVPKVFTKMKNRQTKSSQKNSNIDVSNKDTIEEWADGEIEIDVSTSNPSELFQMAQEERLENRQVAIKLYEMALEAYDKELSIRNDSTTLYEKAMCLKQCGRFIGFTDYLAISLVILKQLKMEKFVQQGINLSYQIQITEFIQISVILKAITKNQQDVSTFEEASYHLLLTSLTKVLIQN
jgi:tetratricopeptide (TPR) repeat protein